MALQQDQRVLSKDPSQLILVDLFAALLQPLAEISNIMLEIGGIGSEKCEIFERQTQLVNVSLQRFPAT